MPDPDAAFCPVPVILIVFNRPATTRRVFDWIAQARPAKLLIVADGPRPDRTDEEALCREVREIVSAIDWPCEVHTNFAPSNLGCCERIVTGLDWAFSIVEEAVVLEDDCFPDPSFFRFCDEMLKRYHGDPRIAGITGTNFVENCLHTSYDYYFSRLGGVWGWATWRSRWQAYDRYLRNWPEVRRSEVLSEILDRPKDIAYWTQVFDAMFEGRGPDTWDYQWFYTNLFGNRLIVVPRVNLITNIGFGEEATHTGIADPRVMPQLKAMNFPLKHPAVVIPSRSVDRHHLTLYYHPLWRRLLRLIKRTVSKHRKGSAQKETNAFAMFQNILWEANVSMKSTGNVHHDRSEVIAAPNHKASHPRRGRS